MSIERLNNTIKNNKTTEFMKQYIKVVNKYNSIFISLNAIKTNFIDFTKHRFPARSKLYKNQ